MEWLLKGAVACVGHEQLAALWLHCGCTQQLECSKIEYSRSTTPLTCMNLASMVFLLLWIGPGGRIVYSTAPPLAEVPGASDIALLFLAVSVSDQWSFCCE